MRSGIKKRTSKSWKRKGVHAAKRKLLHPFSSNYPLPIYASTINDLRRRTACQTNVRMAKFCPIENRYPFFEDYLSCAFPPFYAYPHPDFAKFDVDRPTEELDKKKVVQQTQN